MSCPALRNVPKNKLLHAIAQKESGSLTTGQLSAIKTAYTRYFEANIPYIYWDLEPDKNLKNEDLKNVYHSIVDDLAKTYNNGNKLCFAGNFGTGKTLVCSAILKRALEKGFGGLYTTLTDIISVMTTNSASLARKELFSCDFLVIDEFDPRYMPTDSAADFFARILEDVVRVRVQNRIPLFLCTNSPNPVAAFNGSHYEAIKSLANHMDIIPVLGKDYRPIAAKEQNDS